MFDGPGRYRICVRAELSAIYSKRLNDLTVTVELQEGQQLVTTLTGDAAAVGAAVVTDDGAAYAVAGATA
jgi:hypothetical protein